MKRVIIILTISALLAICAIKIHAKLYPTLKAEQMKSTTTTPLYTLGEEIGKVENSKLDEISGMAASSRYRDTFWVNNDSGDQPNIYLINLAGELIATLSLPAPTTNRDWEGITIADGYIYIGEIGDNLAIYPHKKIYRVAEPTTIDIKEREQMFEAQSVETMHFNFADGKRDSETLMFDPISQELVLVSKRELNVMVYTTPFIENTQSDVRLIESCATLKFTLATAGDISLDGSKILVKNYPNIFYWERTPGESIAQALSKEHTILEYDPEPQGESIVWSTHEDAFYTISEKRGDVTPVVYKYSRVL